MRQLLLFAIIFLAKSSLAQFVPVSLNTSSTSAPFARYGHSLNADKNGGLWVFGGYGTGSNNVNDYHFSLWRYNQSSGSYVLVDGSNVAGVNGREASKPSPRCCHASWVDVEGNIWIFGGLGYGESGNTTGILGDTWVYNTTDPQANKWRYVGGSKTINVRVAGQLEPRRSAGHWKDASDGSFYVFGGEGFTTATGIRKFRFIVGHFLYSY